MIYLDNAATTLIHSGIDHDFEPLGNATSRTHPIGLKTRKQVESAREKLGQFFSVPPGCVVFTSGATESLFILGRWAKRRGLAITCSNQEHAAMLMNADHAFKSLPEGFQDQHVFSRMVVNNELGTAHNDWKRAKELGAAFTLADATQAIGKVDIDMEASSIDYLVGSAHKFHGPTGCGFIVARTRKLLASLVDPKTN